MVSHHCLPFTPYYTDFVVPDVWAMRVAPWLATILVVFVAEWADLTQLASAARSMLAS